MSIPFIVMAVVVNVLIGVAVLGRALARQRSSGAPLLGVDLGQLKAFTDASHRRIGEYLEANYGGQPEQLPDLLKALLDELETQSKSRGLPLIARCCAA